MKKFPNFELLKKLSNLKDNTKIRDIFNSLINDLKEYLNIDVVNTDVKLHVINDIKDKVKSEKDHNHAIKYFYRENTFHFYIHEEYNRFFPFLLLQCAYLTFIPDHLKETKLITFAINQFVEYDLQESILLHEWRSFIIKKFVDHDFLLSEPEKFRFDKFLRLKETNYRENPKQFFFKYLRQYQNLNYDNNLINLFKGLFEGFLFNYSKDFKRKKFAETLRIVTKIFYFVKNSDTLQEFYKYFRTFKNQGLIHTNLSIRKFKKNLMYINNLGQITPTY